MSPSSPVHLVEKLQKKDCTANYLATNLATMSKESPSPILSVRNLTVCYDRKPALWEVNLDIPPQSLTGIIGPNGAGKSTFLKSILGLIPKTSGAVKFFDQPYKEVKQRVAYVPQRGSVDWDYPINARDVVTMGLYKSMGLFRWVGKKERTLAEEALDRVGMLPFADSQIGELSGGQQQRIFLARALVQNADLYLLDEPFVGIDATTEKVILRLIQDVQKEGSSVICVHHDLATVAEYFNHVAMLNVQLVANGSMVDTFNEASIKRCYGAQSDLITKLADSFARLEQLKGLS